MPEFQYLAIRAGEHKITKGVADRPSLQAFENDAIDRRLAVLKVERKREKDEEKVSRAKIPLKVKINFFQQMATCYRLQIHLAKAFDIMQDACANKTFKAILREVKE
jgi:type II secretory pathway component PulF